MYIKLDSGIEVKVDSFIFGRTYAGLIEGSPNKSLNKRIFKHAKYPVSSWGIRKVLKIKPTKKEFRTELKPICCAVWLTSEPIKFKYHGSELVVIWFGKLLEGKPIEEIIKEGIKGIDWKKNAKDFYY